MAKHSSFSHFLKGQDWSTHSSGLQQIGPLQIEFALKRQGQGGIDDLRALLSPLAGEKYLEDMAKLSHSLTRKRFGQAIRLFAPMYLSNECNNVCDYCGFSMHNKIARKTLTDLEILREAGILKKRGFDHVLLVTGESNQQVGMNYLSHAIDLLRPHFANLSIEVQPLSLGNYSSLIEHGIHAVMVYQETYNQESYSRHHLKGKKTNFEWRLDTADRLGQAGVNKIGLGCLFGLTEDWRVDAFYAGMHLDYLERRYWQTSYSMSFPRIRPYEGDNIVAVDLKDRDLVQLLCAFRIFNHELEITLSTRESQQLRENLLPLGVTTMSAGSKTNPGGYAEESQSLEQFSISDERSPREVSAMLKSKGYDPVWKDWDSSYDKPRMTNVDSTGLQQANSPQVAASF
ncbi:2-iminoacetate synthase ThiH [Opitutales bacterium]|nr:2-iminoacetate synthase ThiH [Opitutales bacterium]